MEQSQTVGPSLRKAGRAGRADKRTRTEATQETAKRRKLNGDERAPPIYVTNFSKEEIDAEGRKPKKKVAVMMGYSGSGYKGMQINNEEKTIEGDLFKALVAAGAISKANADDPKKSSLVRCARTDRGVHAAGNVISLKMILEDPDIIAKINEHLSPQIRVWGAEQTNGSFSAYQLCDSRIYEYLIPTYCFLPPHPESFLGKELVKLAEEAGDSMGLEERQQEVSSFWKETEENHVKPFLDGLSPELSASVRNALYDAEPKILDLEPEAEPATSDDTTKPMEIQAVVEPPDLGRNDGRPVSDQQPDDIQNAEAVDKSKVVPSRPDAGILLVEEPPVAHIPNKSEHRPQLSALEEALKKLKSIIISAKKAYRIQPARLARVQSVLNHYIGTRNFHNYTISKLPRDPSAKRVIKSFTVNPQPILINNTEWLSLKVHGQSFMMHQIRKMVTMVALVVRCGCPEERMKESYGEEKLTIPKAPSLGLLLERPVFETYNRNLVKEGPNARAEVGFERYEKEVEEFKQREIYERIFREEERDDTYVSFLYSFLLSWGLRVANDLGNRRFHSFFASLDGMRWGDLLYLSSVGLPAVRKEIPKSGDGEGKGGNARAVALEEDSEGADRQDG
ncbi:MAG: hypothetical protein Q9216_002892 [Gyalolechia sp. 2 TL-2023]